MMQNNLWMDIQTQADNLRHVITHMYGQERARLEVAAELLQNDRPIVLIGVASAEYLCMPAEIYLVQHGYSARTICASDAVYSHLPALRSSNVVINSRSGETAEVVKLGRALVEAGIPFLTITNEPESSIARMATHILWADTHKDDLVSINVVTGMMTATLILATAVCGELDAQRSEFEALPAKMATVVQNAAVRADRIAALFAATRPIYLLYRGLSKGSANCGRLVLEEVARTSGIAMEAAEFRQGPNEVIDERFGAVIFIPPGKQGELNLSLSVDVLRSGGRCLLVGAENSGVQNPNLISFSIPETPDYLRPVLEVVPVQFLAYHLAQAQGYEPGDTRYITKVILTEEGIPNQV